MIRSIFVRNIGLSSVLKLASFLLQFLMLPLLVKALGKGEYGVWVAMQSLVVWVMILEFGLGKGVRNKVIDSLSQDRVASARRYISSTFFGQMFLWGGIAVCLGLVLFFGGLPLARWFKSTAPDRNLAWGIFFSFLALALNQVAGVMNAILYAKHWNSATSLVGFLSSLGLFLWIWLATGRGFRLDLQTLALVHLLMFATAYTTLAGYLFNRFPELRPLWRDTNWDSFREVVSIGIPFLIIEVTYIVIFMMDRWIVLRAYDAAAVAEFDIMLRLSALVTTGYSMCVGPIWALSGSAWAKRDLAMLDKLWRIVTSMMIPFAILSVVIGLSINFFIHRWIDATITLSPLTRCSMVIYMWVILWGNSYVNLLNGIGRTREQMLCSLVACCLNIPLAMYLCSWSGVGIAGVLIASTISLSFFALIAPFAWLDSRKACSQAV
jgi:O-antigen/teichoic acid export membrane protein